MTFAEYLANVATYYDANRAPSNGNIRLGQAYANCLPIGWWENPVHKELLDTFDPYYNDSNIADFLTYVERHWCD